MGWATWENLAMGCSAEPCSRFPVYLFPAVIIGEVVWPRFRFNLSLRDIPALMTSRVVELSHQTVWDWCDTFGAASAQAIRRRRPRPGDKWHLDAMVIRINGVQQCLWRAVDQHVVTLGIINCRSRGNHAARRFLHNCLSPRNMCRLS